MRFAECTVLRMRGRWYKSVRCRSISVKKLRENNKRWEADTGCKKKVSQWGLKGSSKNVESKGITY